MVDSLSNYSIMQFSYSSLKIVVFLKEGLNEEGRVFRKIE